MCGQSWHFGNHGSTLNPPQKRLGSSQNAVSDAPERHRFWLLERQDNCAGFRKGLLFAGIRLYRTPLPRPFDNFMDRKTTDHINRHVRISKLYDALVPT